MDLEKLTKSQIVLLTLLVSFVTSIATGIVSISLMDQAPPLITQSVSRVVRETIQTASPKPSSQAAAAMEHKPAVEVSEAPPPANLATIVANANRSVARLYGGSKDAPTFLGLGIILDADGLVVSDTDALGSFDRIVLYAGSSSTPMKVSSRDRQAGLSYLLPSASSSIQFAPAQRTETVPSVGDTLIAFAGKETLRIASGMVAEFSPGSSTLIATLQSNTIIKGSPLINERGQFIGLSTGVSRSIDPEAFMMLSALSPHSAGVHIP